MFPELVQSLIDWYKWRYKWYYLLHDEFRSLQVIIQDDGIVRILLKSVIGRFNQSFCIKDYNWRRLSGRGIYYSNGIQLSKRYIYTSGLNNPNGYTCI